jgi:hypothetical protein
MSLTTLPAHPTSLDRVRWRFERWRQSRQRRSPIPERLWAVAVAAAKTHGVHRAARTLRLNYTDLKRRAGMADGAPAWTPFVELLSVPVPRSPTCTLELETARGTKLRLQLQGITPPDLVTLSRTLWQAAR